MSSHSQGRRNLLLILIRFIVSIIGIILLLVRVSSVFTMVASFGVFTPLLLILIRFIVSIIGIILLLVRVSSVFTMVASFGVFTPLLLILIRFIVSIIGIILLLVRVSSVLTMRVFIPLLLILILSFVNMGGEDDAGATGGSRYFSLTPVQPHTNPLATKLATVKDIPYYVSDQFLRTVARDRYQLSQVERMVERSYERYLSDECKSQKVYKRKLELLSVKSKITEAERENLMRKSRGFELTRCLELEDLFPRSVPAKDRVDRHSEF